MCTATSRARQGPHRREKREEDFVEYLFVASAHSYILLFSSKGRVYWLKVYEIPRPRRPRAARRFQVW